MDFHKDKAVISQKIIILNNKKEVLLLQRPSTDMSRPNGWDFPGGALEKLEDPIAGIKREVQEETGLIVKSVTLLSVTSFPLHDGCWTILVLYQADCESETIVLSNEHQQFQWMRKDQILSSSMPKRYKDFVRSFL